MKLNKWQMFVKERMSSRMKKFKGDHGKALRSIAKEWKEKKRKMGIK